MNTLRTGRVMAILAVLAAATAACGGDSEPVARADKPRDTVTMRLIAFRPPTLAVKPGTTVIWLQKDAGVHTVTSGTVLQGTGGVTEMPNGAFDSGSIATGDTFRFTFDTAGTYTYFCHIHPATMRGEVRVA